MKSSWPRHGASVGTLQQLFCPIAMRHHNLRPPDMMSATRSGVHPTGRTAGCSLVECVYDRPHVTRSSRRVVIFRLLQLRTEEGLSLRMLSSRSGNPVGTLSS